jgi:peptide/nickel transport system permease protein
MWSYAVSRLLQASIVIVAVTLITFLALQMSGDPTYLYVSDRASEEEIALMRERLGFDRPLHVQYLTFLGGLVQGDTGRSLTYRMPALPIVLERLPATIELTLMAMLIAVTFAIPSGSSRPSTAARRSTAASWPSRWWGSRSPPSGSGSC